MLVIQMPTNVPYEQLTNNFGVRNTHPVGEGEIEGDKYENDGTGVPVAGCYWYHLGAWVLIGAGGMGVDTQNGGVPVDTPAATIDFNEGVIATGGGGTTQVDCDWAPDGSIQSVAAANAGGIGVDVARGDHAHEGVHSVSKFGDPALVGDVTLSEGANITLTQVGNDIAIAAAGGGAALAVSDEGVPVDPAVTSMDFVGVGVTVASTGPGAVQVNVPGAAAPDNMMPDQKPRDYHDLHLMDSGLLNGEGLRDLNGSEGERCIALCNDGRVLHLRAVNPNGFDPSANMFVLTVEHQNETDASQYQKMTYEIQLTPFEDYDEVSLTLVPEAGFAMTTEIGLLGVEMLHIVFTAVLGFPGPQNIYDFYIPTANLPQPGGLPTPLVPAVPPVIPVTAECVNKAYAGACSWPSVAANRQLSNGPGVVVAWIQDIGAGFTECRSNYYDPSVAVGSRYGVYAEKTITDLTLIGVYNCTRCTVEVGQAYIHYVYTCLDGSGSTHMYYTSEVVSGVNPAQPSNLSVDGRPFGTLPLDMQMAGPSMVVIDNVATGNEEVVLIGQDVGGLTLQAGSLAMYHFNNVAVFTFISEAAIDVYGLMQSQNEYPGGYQLSCSPTMNNIGDPEPVFYLYKMMRESHQSGHDFVLLYKPMSSLDDTTLPWNHVTLLSGSDYGLLDDVLKFVPKVAFNFDYPVRAARVDDKPWYPANHHLRTAYIRYEQTLATLRVMISKDLPSWVLEQN